MIILLQLLLKRLLKKKTLEDKFKEQQEKWDDSNPETTELERILDGRRDQYWKIEDRIHALRNYLDSASNESKEEIIKIRNSKRAGEIKKLLYQVKERKSIQKAVDKGRLDSDYLSKTLKDIENYLDNMPINYLTVKLEQERLQKEAGFRKPAEIKPSEQSANYENVVPFKSRPAYVQKPFEYHFDRKPKQRTWIKTAAKSASRIAAGFGILLAGFASLSGAPASHSNNPPHSEPVNIPKIVQSTKPELNINSKINKDSNQVKHEGDMPYMPSIESYNHFK